MRRAPGLLLLALLAGSCRTEPEPPEAPPLPTIRVDVALTPDAKLDLRFRRDVLPQFRRETPIRIVVDLAQQPDLKALGREADAAGLDRERRKRFVAERLAAGVPEAAALAAELRGRPDVSDVVQASCLARIAFTAPARVVKEIAQRPGIAWGWGRALAPPPAHPVPDVRTPGEGARWAPAALGAPAAWERGWRGKGVHACVLDSVAAVVPAALAGRQAQSALAHPPPGSQLPDDGRGHGLAVIGAAVGDDGLGVAPEASWSVANPLGGGVLDPEAFAAVVDWLLRDARPDVVVAPWDVPPGDVPDYQLAVPFGALRTAGMAVAFPAGNTGPMAGLNAPPANLPDLAPDGAPAFSVGGVDRALAAYEPSNRGPNAHDGSLFPLVAAPAADVSILDPASGAVRSGWGTSYAVGFAGGALALVLGSDPRMTGPQAEKLLRDTARDLGAPGPDDVFGHGLIDLDRASGGAAPAPPAR